MSKTKHVVYLGSIGFPYGLAEIQKMTLISKGLVYAGYSVTVINRRGLHNAADHKDLLPQGMHDGIAYVYTSGSPFRPDGFIKRNWLKVKGRIAELSFLWRKKRNRELDIAILSTNRFLNVLYYSLLGRVIGFKTLLNYAEYYPAIASSNSATAKRLNSFFYDRYAPRLVSGVLPISEFLIGHLKKNRPRQLYFKVPVLTDVQKFDAITARSGDDYFLFCGDATYKEIITFIIDAFATLENKACQLFLVVNGNPADIQAVKDYAAAQTNTGMYRFFSKLPQDELYALYRGAKALLIPLRPTEQDSARFPHKIGEYLAAGKPVVSTNYGEVKHYFQDGVNMLVAGSYDVHQFAKKMQEVIDDPVRAAEIGRAGRKLAEEKFDYRGQSAAFDAFIRGQLLGAKRQ